MKAKIKAGSEARKEKANIILNHRGNNQIIYAKHMVLIAKHKLLNKQVPHSHPHPHHEHKSYPKVRMWPVKENKFKHT